MSIGPDFEVVRAPNDWVAVVTGVTSSRPTAEPKMASVRWMAVYTRQAMAWVLVASQATRVGDGRVGDGKP